MQKYRCTICDWMYDPYEDLPDDWTCPLCLVGKEDFEPYEE